MKSFESFEANRWIWRINLGLQVVLVLALVLIVNFIGMNESMRFDLTRNRAFSLAPETIGYIHDLHEPVHVIVTFPNDEEDDVLAQAFRDVRSLLREFVYASRDNPDAPITVEYLNVYEQRKRAETLGIADQPNVVVFQAGSRKRTVLPEELYQTGYNRSAHGIERREFRGEKVFTSALLDVTSREQPVLYFLSGHGEMQLDRVDPARGASQLDANLLGRNYLTRRLDLAAVRRVPEDASMVLILSPQAPILSAERKLLRDYLTTGNGRILITLDPGVQHGLDDLLLDWGILVGDDRVEERDPGYLLPGGDILVRRKAPHPITQALVDNEMTVLFGVARSVRADPGRPLDESLAVTELLFSSDNSWAEVNYFPPGRTPHYDPDRDLKGPVPMAAVAERKVDTNARYLPGGRLIVIGSSDFLVNNRIGQVGNLTLFLNAVRWAIGRDSQLDIPARPVEKLKLNFSQEQLAITRLSVALGPALFVALLGAIILFARRR